MNRFNQWLWAILGLSFLGFIAMGVIQTVLWRHRGESAGVAAGPEATGGKPKAPSTRVACLPLRVPGSAIQLIPIAVLRFDDAPLLPSYSSHSGTVGLCRLNHVDVDGGSEVVNVVVRDTGTGKQHLLLDAPAVIEEVVFADGGDAVPPGKLLWKMRTADTDYNKVINPRDALGAFLSDLAGEKVTRVIPEGASYLASYYDKAEDALYLLSYRDSAVDGKLGAGEHAGLTRVRLATGALEHDVVDPALDDRLAALSHTPTERERLTACCVRGCINDSGGDEYCRKACTDSLAAHPERLESPYCPDFLP